MKDTENGISCECVHVTQRDRINSGGSKGNQTKWFKEGYWYKADFLGFEGLAESICSCLLYASDIRQFVKYYPVNIYEEETGECLLGCKSSDFGTIISGDVIMLHLPDRYNVWLNPTGSLPSDFTLFCQGVKQIFDVDIADDMKAMLQFDLITGNEDRVLRNFGLIKKGASYEFAPLFDHGLSLLSDKTSINRKNDIDNIIYNPFGHFRKRGYGLNGLDIKPIIINMELLEKTLARVTVYPKTAVDGMLRVLRKSMNETEGILWARME